jgi:hypothetical protein
MLLECGHGNVCPDTWGSAKTREVRMIYADGEPVQIGDAVRLGGGQNGIVVGIIEEGKYANGYRKEDWDYLSGGLIISTDFGDLRLNEPDEDLELLARPASNLRFG